MTEGARESIGLYVEADVEGVRVEGNGCNTFKTQVSEVLRPHINDRYTRMRMPASDRENNRTW